MGGTLTIAIFLLVVPAFSTLRGPVGVVGVERVGVGGGGLWVRCWVLRERAVACCLAGWLMPVPLGVVPRVGGCVGWSGFVV